MGNSLPNDDPRRYLRVVQVFRANGLPILVIANPVRLLHHLTQIYGAGTAILSLRVL